MLFLILHDTDEITGDMHNRMGITPRRLIAALGDYDLWPVSFGYTAGMNREANNISSFTSSDVRLPVPRHAHLIIANKNTSTQLHSSKSTRDILDAVSTPDRLRSCMSSTPLGNPC